MSSVTDSAAGAVQKLFNKVKAPAADADRKLAAAAAEAEQPTERVLIGEDEAAAATMMVRVCIQAGSVLHLYARRDL